MIPKRSLMMRFVLFFAVGVATAAASTPLFSEVVRSPGFWPVWVMVAISLAAAMTWAVRNRPWIVTEEEQPLNELVEP